MCFTKSRYYVSGKLTSLSIVQVKSLDRDVWLKRFLFLLWSYYIKRTSFFGVPYFFISFNMVFMVLQCKHWISYQTDFTIDKISWCISYYLKWRYIFASTNNTKFWSDKTFIIPSINGIAALRTFITTISPFYLITTHSYIPNSVFTIKYSFSSVSANSLTYEYTNFSHALKSNPLVPDLLINS